ncbi:2-oxo acid dehydrogenase subunit E2 [Candidatus Woesearchaeota archaeon]|nr:2-oxo acid dehydrogenase subunit E2 [Candidatus Woesearchaeota archaeon]
MAYEFKFPDVGEGIQEGEIVKWVVKQGDIVKADQPLGEVETDKAVVEIPSPKAGKILKLHVKEGGIIKVGAVMVTIDDGSKNVKEEKVEKKDQGAVVGFLDTKESQIKTSEKKVISSGEKVLATPAVRKLAKDLGVDINLVASDGIVTQDDVMKEFKGKEVVKQAPEPQMKKMKKYDMFGYVDHSPLKGVKKAMAEKMAEAEENVSPVTFMDEADVSSLAVVRANEKERAAKKGVRMTYLPYIVKAVIEGMGKFPILNSSMGEGEVIVKKYFNFGIAVDTPNGLIVPVLKGANNKDLYAIANEIVELADKAKNKKLDLMDLKGGTFTITNIGVLGGRFFTPIINFPEAAILGIGKMHDKIVVKNDKVGVRKLLPFSLTYDHRIIDGAEAARFLSIVISKLENEKWVKGLR